MTSFRSSLFKGCNSFTREILFPFPFYGHQGRLIFQKELVQVELMSICYDPTMEDDTYISISTPLIPDVYQRKPLKDRHENLTSTELAYYQRRSQHLT